MILEEVMMNQPKKNNDISIETVMTEHTELLIEHNELLSEMADMLVAMLNEECIFTESFFDDMKVKKEDLADPNKVKAIIKRLDKEGIAPDKKDNIINTLYVFLLAIVSMLPGFTMTMIGMTLSKPLFASLGYLIAMIGPIIVGYSLDRLDSYISKTKKAIKKVEKKLNKEKDPQNIKALKSQLDALNKNLKLFEKENYRVKKDQSDGKISQWT